MKRRVLTILRFLLFLGFGLFLIWYVVKDFTEEEIASMKASFREASYFWVVLSVFMGIASHISRAMRWKMMLAPLGYNPRLSSSFYAIMVGYISNLAFHRVGEVIRCGILNKYEKVPVSKSLGTVVMERVIDLLILFVLFALVLVTQFNRFQQYFDEHIYQPFEQKLKGASGDLQTWIIVCCILFITALILLLRKKLASIRIFSKIGAMISGFWVGLKSVKHVKNLPLFLAHTSFIWLMYFSMIWINFHCLPELNHLGPLTAVTLLVFGAVALIVVQGGIGIYPFTIQQILLLYGIKATTGYAFGWIVWSAQTIMIISLGLLSLLLLSLNSSSEKVPAA